MLWFSWELREFVAKSRCNWCNLYQKSPEPGSVLRLEFKLIRGSNTYHGRTAECHHKNLVKIHRNTQFSPTFWTASHHFALKTSAVFCVEAKIQYNHLASLCDLFGMVKWDFQRLCDLQLRDKNKNVTLNHLAWVFSIPKVPSGWPLKCQLEFCTNFETNFVSEGRWIYTGEPHEFHIFRSLELFGIRRWFFFEKKRRDFWMVLNTGWKNIPSLKLII